MAPRYFSLAHALAAPWQALNRARRALVQATLDYVRAHFQARPDGTLEPKAVVLPPAPDNPAPPPAVPLISLRPPVNLTLGPARVAFSWQLVRVTRPAAASPPWRQAEWDGEVGPPRAKKRPTDRRPTFEVDLHVVPGEPTEGMLRLQGALRILRPPKGKES